MKIDKDSIVLLLITTVVAISVVVSLKREKQMRYDQFKTNSVYTH